MRISSRLVTIMLSFSIIVGSIQPTVYAMSNNGSAQPSIDMQTDSNADGVADEFAKEVNKLAAYQGDQKLLEQKVGELVNKVAFSAETIEKQKQIYNLYSQINESTSAKRAEQINLQIVKLQGELMSDANYANTVRSLDNLFSPFYSGSAKTSKTYQDDVSVNNTRVNGKSASDFLNLKRGDIMLINNKGIPSYLYAMNYSHSGTYDGDSYVYESNTDGVRLKKIARWQTFGSTVAFGRNNKISATAVIKGLDWAKNKYGTDGRTGYNYVLPNKTTDSRLYCSQLVWKIHMNQNVDLDSNDWRYLAYITFKYGSVLAGSLVVPAVAPDEIALDNDVNIYKVFVNN